MVMSIWICFDSSARDAWQKYLMINGLVSQRKKAVAGTEIDGAGKSTLDR